MNKIILKWKGFFYWIKSNGNIVFICRFLFCFLTIDNRFLWCQFNLDFFMYIFVILLKCTFSLSIFYEAFIIFSWLTVSISFKSHVQNFYFIIWRLIQKIAFGNHFVSLPIEVNTQKLCWQGKINIKVMKWQYVYKGNKRYYLFTQRHTP